MICLQNLVFLSELWYILCETIWIIFIFIELKKIICLVFIVDDYYIFLMHSYEYDVMFLKLLYWLSLPTFEIIRQK